MEPNFTDRVREHVPVADFELLSLAIPIPRAVFESWSDDHRLKVQREVSVAALAALHQVETEST